MSHSELLDAQYAHTPGWAKYNARSLRRPTPERPGRIRRSLAPPPDTVGFRTEADSNLHFFSFLSVFLSGNGFASRTKG